MKKTMKLLVFITFLSLILFIVLETISPETGFFLLPGRLWEFLVGVHLASFLDTYNKKFRVSTFTFRMVLITFPVFILIIDLMKVEKSPIFNVFAVVYTLILLFLGFLLFFSGIKGLTKLGLVGAVLLVIHAVLKILFIVLVHFNLITLGV